MPPLGQIGLRGAFWNRRRSPCTCRANFGQALSQFGNHTRHKASQSQANFITLTLGGLSIRNFCTQNISNFARKVQRHKNIILEIGRECKYCWISNRTCGTLRALYSCQIPRKTLSKFGLWRESACIEIFKNCCWWISLVFANEYLIGGGATVG